MKKSLILIAVSIILAIACVLPALANEPSITVSLRIEGKDENLFYEDISTNNALNYNIMSILSLADSKSDKLIIEGLGYGYITAINGTKIGQSASGKDSYTVRVNGKYVAFDQISTYPLHDGDEIIVYYGEEFGSGMMFPIVDTNKLDQGYIKFTCEVPSEDGKSVTTKSIVGATVTWYCDDVPFTYVTDAQGGFYIEKSAFTSGTHRLGLELKDENGTPLLLRLPPNYTVEVPVGIGDSFAMYVFAALSLISLGSAIAICLSLKKKIFVK